MCLQFPDKNLKANAQMMYEKFLFPNLPLGVRWKRHILVTFTLNVAMLRWSHIFALKKINVQN